MAEELDPIKQVIHIDVKENGAEDATKDIDKLNTSISETTTATANQTKENKKSEEGFKTLKTQLREAIAEQQKLSQQYGSTSKEAIAATKAVAGIKDEIEFQKDLVKSYNPDDKFRKLTQTAGVAALALGGVKDGFTALGIESKTLDDIIGSAQAILGVTSAVSGMSDAYQILTATKRAKSAADVVEIGTTEALTVAEAQATTATWSWNTALLANPIVLITAGIIAASAAIYAFVKITSDAVKEEEKLKVASMQLTREIDNQSKSFENNISWAEKSNNQKINLLKASGANEQQIYKETKALAEQELQLAKNFLKEANLAEQKAYLANRDNPTEFNKDTLKKAQENIEKAEKAVSAGYDKLIELQNNHEVAIVQARTDARNKADEEERKRRQKAIEEEERLEKERIEREKQRLQEFNQFKNAVNNAEIENRIKERNDEEQSLIDFNANIEAIEKIKTDKEIEEENRIAQSKKENQDLLVSQGEQLIANVQKLAGKNKAIQKATIIADGGISVGKAVANTSEAVTKDLAKGAPFSAPLVALDLAVGATSVASIIKGTSEALKAVGGGGATVGGNASSSLPTRNVAQVGFQASSENQIGSAVTKAEKERPPLQAFVVSQQVTDQQEIDRKKELLNSF